MTHFEERLLTAVEGDSRYDTAELAVRLGSSEAEVVETLMKLEQDGVICGYHTMIDWDKTDVEKVHTLNAARVTPPRGIGFEDIAERIYQYPEVTSMYLMSGAYDFMVILEGRTLREVSGFVSNKLSTLDTVISTATHFILKKYKDHSIIMEGKKTDEREKIMP